MTSKSILQPEFACIIVPKSVHGGSGEIWKYTNEHIWTDIETKQEKWQKKMQRSFLIRLWIEGKTRCNRWTNTEDIEGYDTSVRISKTIIR